MSDEPLFCPWCGLEIGDGCECTANPETRPMPKRIDCYCEVCGVIPALGKECHFYVQGGRADYCEPEGSAALTSREKGD